MPRLSQAVIAGRVADIYGLVVDGVPLAQMRRYVAANCSWQASERAIQRYMAKARVLMLEAGKVERRQLYAESLARKQRLFARASLANQLKTALAVQNSIDRMFGDFAGEQEDHSAVDEFLAAMRSGKFVKRDE